MKFKNRFYLSPYFVSRYYLIQMLEQSIAEYKFNGTLMDVGCGSKPYEELFERSNYQGIDFSNFSVNKDFHAGKPDYFFRDDYPETLSLPFKNNSFNNSIALEVLEHHRNPSKFVDELYRITKDNGYILIAVPFMGGVHEEPYDYQRFTRYGLIELFKKHKFRLINIKEYGSICSTIAKIINDQLSHFADQGKFKRLIATILYPPFLLFEYSSLIVDKIFKSKRVFLGYVIVLKVAKEN
jgi:SAM-dependent methyltransferase